MGSWASLGADSLSCTREGGYMGKWDRGHALDTSYFHSAGGHLDLLSRPHLEVATLYPQCGGHGSTQLIPGAQS